jgi:hypothetical protein
VNRVPFFSIQPAPEPSTKCPEIVTGSCIEDRKSVFQAHFAAVSSADEVAAVITSLLANKKIANATHNMYAYRIRKRESEKVKMRTLVFCTCLLSLRSSWFSIAL